MFHRWAALVLVLALCAISPKNAAGQTQSKKPREPGAGKLGRNYPNPANPETFIPFDVDADVCVDGSQPHVVSLHIYSVLSVRVASPILHGAQPTSITPVPPGLQAPLNNLRLGCGRYVAWWSGKLAGGKEAASGAYFAKLFVDGKDVGTLRIFFSK